MNPNQITELEKMAESNNGHCISCNQTIKIYHYKINRTHGIFLRAMALEVRTMGVNDVDISTLGLPYSIRSQVTKMRQHGLIARIKGDNGKQIARHWLITHKGYEFLNGTPIMPKVVIYNNQVLGHIGDPITIHSVMGEPGGSTEKYTEAPITEPEAKLYDDVRTPQKYMIVNAKFKGRDYHGRFKTSQEYELQIKKLEVGNPVRVVGIDGQPYDREYRDIAAFQQDWMAV